MPVVMLLAALAILAGVVIVASGRGGEMAHEYPDYPPLDLGPVTAADVALFRPPSAAWGYNMRLTDEALERIAQALTERDVRISALQQQVADLRNEKSRQEQQAPGQGNQDRVAAEQQHAGPPQRTALHFSGHAGPGCNGSPPQEDEAGE
ncbi:MAG TPA: hypothetical protein VE733_17375 [Streptosporangiaceae bacterium]|nr:hypothetical protein [Streptosporangiaceae bacterium]